MKKLLNKLGIYDAKSFRAFVWQFFKFGIVGVSNTLVFFAIYYPLLHFGVHYIIAHIIGFTIGTLNAFVWNRKFVFKQAEGKKSVQLVKVFVAYGLTGILSSVFLFIMVDIIGISEYLAPIINLCFTTPTNFLLVKFWVFRKRKVGEHSSPLR